MVEEGLSWRNKEKEGYIRVGRFYIPKDTLQYYTEVDIVDRFMKHKDVPREVAEDMVKMTFDFLKYRLRTDNGDLGFKIPFLGYCLRYKVNIEDITLEKDSPKYKRARKQLDYYMSKKHNRLQMR